MHHWPRRVWWLEKHYWADSECALNTVDAVCPPFLTLVRLFTHRLTLFFVSPLSLRPGVAGVCFELRSGESLCLDGLCHVISVWKSAVHRSAVRSNASSKFLQNYAGRRVRQPRTPNTSAARVVANLITTKSLSCQENCFTLDSHMLTSDSFFSLQTQHDQSQGNTNTTSKQTRQNRRGKGDNVLPLSVCLMLS